MKKKHFTTGIGFFIALVMILAAAGLALYTLIPSTAEQLGSNQKTFLQISITTPFDRGQVLAGQKVGVFAHVASASPLVSVELFADGEKMTDIAGKSPLEKKSASFAWSWMATTPGMVRLVAKAVDAEGYTAFSNPVRVFVSNPPDPLEQGEEIIPQQRLAEYSNDLASALLSSDLVGDENLDELIESLPVKPIIITEAPLIPSSEPPQAITSHFPSRLPSLPPAQFVRFSLWLQNFSKKSMPEAPGLGGKSEGCNAALIIEDRSTNEAGFRLFRASPFDGGFLPIAELEARNGVGSYQFTDSNLAPGKYQYYATALNSGGEVAGNLLVLEISDPACQSLTPLVLSFEPLSIKPKQPVDKLYCYSSQDGTSWQRAPISPTEFVYPIDGAFNLAPHLLPFPPSVRAGIRLELECWGWAADTLVNLGKISFAPKDSTIHTIDKDFLLNVRLGEVPLQINAKLQPLTSIAPPYQLHYPKDLQDCLAHEKSLACAVYEENPYGLAVLAWDWRPEGDCEVEQNCGYNVGDIDGFHIYQVQPALGQPVLIKTVPAHERLALVEPPTIGVAYLHPQYFVRAFRGLEESADSNLLISNKGQFNLTLTGASYSYIVVRVYKYRMPYSEKKFGPIASIPDFTQPGESLESMNALVGYFSYGKKAVGWDGAQWFKYTSLFYDQFLAFDLSKIKGNVTNARLKWEGALSHVGDDSSIAEPMHCGNFIDANTDTSVATYPISLNGELDVTAWVRAWLDELTVYGFGAELPDGFWFRSGIRTLPFVDDITIWGSDQDACFVDINQAQLYVEYDGQ